MSSQGTRDAMVVSCTKPLSSSTKLDSLLRENILTGELKQPVSVAIDAGGYDFQFYSGGIFSGNCGKQLNHGVTIVGYGEASNKTYWLVKNSWGDDWGESGYIRMKRDSSDKRGTCGIAMEASYPVKDSENFLVVN